MRASHQEQADEGNATIQHREHERRRPVRGEGIGLSGSTTTAILADAILKSHPGGKVVHNLICSKSVAEVVTEAGGEPIRSRVGHSFIKEIMATSGAVFGGEGVYGRQTFLLTPPGWSRRLRVHARDFMAGADQRFEGRETERGRAHESEAKRHWRNIDAPPLAGELSAKLTEGEAGEETQSANHPSFALHAGEEHA